MAFARLFISIAAIISFSACSVFASELLDKTAHQQRCKIGVCFAIDGSNSISEEDFWRQRFLARQIIKTIPVSLSPKFAAAQYGISTQAISELTADRSSIRRALKDVEQLFSAKTFLSAGLNFCFSELFEVANAGPVCRRSIIVLMGNGNNNIGSDPIERARLFETEITGGEVLAVRFGIEGDALLLGEISGRREVFDAARSRLIDLATNIVESLGIEADVSFGPES